MCGPQSNSEFAITTGSWILESSLSSLEDQKSEVKKAALFGSRPPANDSLWDAAKKQGFEVIVYDRNIVNREKKIDTDIVATMIEDSYERLTIGDDEMTLVAGDSDYVPAMEKLKRRGIPVDVVFWGHAARELKECARTFINLDQYLNFLKREQVGRPV